jgi:hypothetical protein
MATLDLAISSVQSMFLPQEKASAAPATKPLVMNVLLHLGHVTVCLERFLLDGTVPKKNK